MPSRPESAPRLIGRRLSDAEIIALIREGLEQAEGRVSEARILRAIWLDLQTRRPEAIAPLSEVSRG